MESTQSIKHKLRAVVIGSTGAVGREIVDLLIKSPHYTSVIAVARRSIDRWSQYSTDPKFKLLHLDDLSILGKEQDFLKENIFKGDYDITEYNTIFCCLGSRTKKGDEFIKVDRDYVIYSARLCEYFNIPHFSLISSKGADETSFFKYFKTKGFTDKEVMRLEIPQISIFRPGAILDRDNDDRFGESLLKFIPFIPKIESVDLAKAIVNEAITTTSNGLNDNNKIHRIIEHKEIKSLINL